MCAVKLKMTKPRVSQKKKVVEVVTRSDGGGHGIPGQVPGAAGSSGDAVWQSEAGSVIGHSAMIRDPVLAGGERSLLDDSSTRRKMAADQVVDHTAGSLGRSRASSISSMTEDSGSLQKEHRLEIRRMRGQESPRSRSPRLMPEIGVLRETVSETFEVVGGLHEKIETAIQGVVTYAVKEMASVLSGTLHEAIAEMR